MNLKQTDSQTYNLVKHEEKRQQNTLQMIPSENIASKAVREAVGSVFMNKYSEGLSERRYYQGNEFADTLETLTIERVKELFKVPHANIQPYSGSPANAAVYFALLNQGDLIMGMELASGGHLTHGHPKITFSGKYFQSMQYVVEENGFIDFDKLEQLAIKYKPKIIISGATAYPRTINFKKFSEIANKVGAWHLTDMSHIAGLVAAGVHPSPIPYADIVMFTTHKTIRGPRGAVLLVTAKGLKKDSDLGNKIDKAVFPGLQGGPHNNTTAGIAVCLKEAASPKFIKYAEQVVKNAKTLAIELKKYDFDIVSGGTDNHLILVDLTNKNIDGWCAAWALEYAGIVLNRNSVPFDTKSAFYPSGIRMGTPAITTRGMKEKEMVKIAGWINEVLEEAVTLLTSDLASKDVAVARKARQEFKKLAKGNKKIKEIAKYITTLCDKFPLEN